MAFTRRICRGEKVYVYRVQTYRKDGKVRQNTQYLGKESKKDGKTVILPPKHKCIGVRKILTYGSPVALYNQAKKFGLIKLLDQIFSKNSNVKDIGKKIIVIAINKVLRDDSISNISNWFESTSLSYKINLTHEDFSQKRIRKILEILSNETPDYFGMLEQEIVELTKSKYENESSTLVYDLTGIKFYGKSNNFARYGHEYKKNGYQRQINLLLAITKKNKLPIHHRIVYGNILSVSTVNRLVGELKAFNMKEITVILDRGFYSQRNIEELTEDCKVISALPSNLKIYKEVISRTDNIEDSNKFFRYKGEVFFYKETTIDKKRIITYHSSEKYSRQLQEFFGNVCETEEYLSKIQKERFKSKKDMITELINICKEHYNLFNFEYKRGWTFNFSLKKKAINTRKKHFGKTVLFTTTNQNKKNVIKIYREKDVIEKTFNVMKSRGLEPLKTTTEKSTRSYAKLVVLGYLMLALLKEHVVNEKMSIAKIIDNLSDVKEVLYQDGTTVLADFNKEQREIMESLDLV